MTQCANCYHSFDILALFWTLFDCSIGLNHYPSNVSCIYSEIMCVYMSHVNSPNSKFIIQRQLHKKNVMGS